MDGSAAPALAALLAKHQIGLTVEEVLDELDSAFAAIPGATTLSATEVDFLRAHAEPQAAASGYSQSTAMIWCRPLRYSVRPGGL
jgi:hypothetical protein